MTEGCPVPELTKEAGKLGRVFNLLNQAEGFISSTDILGMFELTKRDVISLLNVRGKIEELKAANNG